MRHQNKGNLTLNTNLAGQVWACEATRFGKGLTELLCAISVSQTNETMFRDQNINTIRDALPACVKQQRLQIKEFPQNKKVSDGWVVYFECTRC